MNSEDIEYLAKIQGTGYTKYIQKAIDYFKMSDEQIHNLRLAVEYDYLYFRDFGDVINNILNGRSWASTQNERKFKMSYEKDFRTKIIEIKKPYPICYLTWNKYPFDINKHKDLDSFELNDIIGEIPAEYPFGKKYLIGKGRYRCVPDYKTLWEQFRNTNRESEFIKVIDEQSLHILTDEEIEKIELVETTNKLNL